MEGQLWQSVSGVHLAGTCLGGALAGNYTMLYCLGQDPAAETNVDATQEAWREPNTRIFFCNIEPSAFEPPGRETFRLGPGAANQAHP